jgi:nucleotide-binding universal stress UspA family protein
MFKRVIVAIDGSRTSHRAFETALDLAVIHGATVQAFYVVENTALYYDVSGFDASGLQKQLAAEGADLGREAAEAMKARGVPGEVKLAEATSIDDIAELVLAAAGTFQADLLVMGTHGRKGVRRLLLGSVAERCLRQATVPVLVIPTAASTEADEDEDEATGA